MQDIFQSVIDDIHDKLNDDVGLDDYGCDLHNELCHHRQIPSKAISW